MNDDLYPRNPVGLNKADHYTMADQVFAAYAHGGASHLPRTMPEKETAQPKRIVAWPRKRAGKRIA